METILSFRTNSFRKRQHEPDEMRAICEANAKDLKTPLNGVAILKTIAQLESSFGNDCRPRFEPAYYYKDGIYFKKSQALRDGYERWGALVSFSYGAFQILWCVANELGYSQDKSPIDLWHGSVSAPYVIALLNRNFSKGAVGLDQVLGCYNGGLGYLKNPLETTKRYVANGLTIYKKLI